MTTPVPRGQLPISRTSLRWAEFGPRQDRKDPVHSYVTSSTRPVLPPLGAPCSTAHPPRTLSVCCSLPPPCAQHSEDPAHAASHRYGRLLSGWQLLLQSPLTPPLPIIPGDWLPVSVPPAEAFRFSPDLLFTWSSAEILQMGRKARGTMGSLTNQLKRL